LIVNELIKTQSSQFSNRFQQQIRANPIQTIVSKNCNNQHQNVSEKFKGLKCSPAMLAGRRRENVIANSAIEAAKK
jgi:hypothetical protein